MAVLIAVRGPSGSGKTTLIERTIARLVSRGVKVGVIKHTHKGFSLDQHGKDSQRFWEAGARAVVAAGPQELFLRQRVPVPQSEAARQAGCAWPRVGELRDLLPEGLDCVFIEGFTRSIAAIEDPIAIRVEFAPEGVRLNGHVVHGDQAIAAIEDAVMSCLARERGVTVKVLLFAQLRDGFGAGELEASLPGDATGARLLEWLSQRNPKLAGLLEVSRLAVNCEYVPEDHRLHDGDEVVVIPPVSGG